MLFPGKLVESFLVGFRRCIADNYQSPYRCYLLQGIYSVFPRDPRLFITAHKLPVLKIEKNTTNARAKYSLPLQPLLPVSRKAQQSGAGVNATP